MQNKITQAVILAAGLGTRLKPLTDTMPKVMVPIAPGKPLLEHTIELLRGQGITDFIINIHYLPDVITSYFGDGAKWGVRIRYSDERDRPLETAGAMKKMEPMLDDNFLFLYGDEFHFFDFGPLITEHLKNGALGTIVLKRSEFPKDGEIGEFDRATKKILRWHTRPHDITALTPNLLVNAGLYAFSKKIVSSIPADAPVKLDGEIIPKAMAAGEPLYAYPTDEIIWDVGRPEKYEKAKEYYASHMKAPKVSILMATYNRAAMIGPTIESIQKQTFKDWELVIPDDGSKDDTEAVVSAWQKKDARIKYIKSAVNQGISRNYNMGFAATRGEYIAMIDDDDPWCDDRKLEKQVKFLDEHPDYVGVGGGVIVVDGSGKEQYRYFKAETDEEIRNYMLYSNPMANSATMFRRAAGAKVGWYDDSICYSGDRDFWLKMGRIGKLYNLKEYFTYYTMAGNNTSITKLRPHLKTSLMVMKRYKYDYPHYWSALALNEVQYAYAFLPEALRRRIHKLLARFKRMVVK
jgi:NDP-sugar pyrophosphorylase family protein